MRTTHLSRRDWLKASAVGAIGSMSYVFSPGKLFADHGNCIFFTGSRFAFGRLAVSHGSFVFLLHADERQVFIRPDSIHRFELHHRSRTIEVFTRHPVQAASGYFRYNGEPALPFYFQIPRPVHRLDQRHWSFQAQGPEN